MINFYKHNFVYKQISLGILFLFAVVIFRPLFISADSAKISGRIFNDANANGIQDDTEATSSLIFWTVDLFQLSSTSVYTQVASQFINGGGYEFDSLPPGSYEVCEEPMAGWTQTAPVTGSTCANGTTGQSFSINDGDAKTDVNFGNYQKAKIGGVVWNDVDKDGTFGGAETGSAGIPILLLDTQGNVVMSTTTNAAGGYLFPDLVPGSYTVYANIGLHKVKSFPTTPTYTVTVQSGDVTIQNNFGIYDGSASITGQVFNDINANGIEDPSEAANPLVFWNIDLFQLGSTSTYTLVDTQLITGGTYNFSSLAPGSYKVCEEPIAGWTQTYPVQNTNCDNGTVGQGVTLLDGQATTSVDFGNYQKAKIGGVVWNDVNMNNVFDNAETGVLGIPATLYNASGVTVATTTTDVSGVYWFNNVTPGTYHVSVQTIPQWVNVATTTTILTVQSGDSSGQNNFGFYHDTIAPQTIINTPLSSTTVSSNTLLISGTTTDVSTVASTRLSYATYDPTTQTCGTYTDITVTTNTSTSTSFAWAYSWLIPHEGVYCITASGQDIAGNTEIGPVVQNITYAVPVVPIVPPAPSAPTSPSVIGNGPISSIVPNNPVQPLFSGVQTVSINQPQVSIVSNPGTDSNLLTGSSGNTNGASGNTSDNTVSVNTSAANTVAPNTLTDAQGQTVASASVQQGTTSNQLAAAATTGGWKNIYWIPIAIILLILAYLFFK